MAESGRGGFEELGETLGGAAGRMAGRAAEAAMDVAGTLFGGWWSSDDARRAGSSFGPEQDRGARTHYESRAGEAGSGYDEVRPLYQLGHVAAHNPDYAGRSFREVEPQLERAWREDQATRYGEWPRVRDYVGHGYETRARGGGTSAGADIRASSRDPLG
jgi:hypothetical protein